MRAEIAFGAVFPDYELSDHTGRHRKLSKLQGPDPMDPAYNGPRAWASGLEDLLRLLVLWPAEY
jgi:hypothetical protein